MSEQEEQGLESNGFESRRQSLEPEGADARDRGSDAEGEGVKDAPRRLWLHILLFLTTVVTTTFCGTIMADAGWSQWYKGFYYSAPLLLILLTHEMGHYIAARIHKIPVSLPYFIPFPIGLGTLGAVISMKGRIGSRNALVDVGAAGPLAGFVVAFAVLFIGIVNSEVREIPVGVASVTEGNSIFYLGLKLLIKREILPSGGRDVFLSPTAMAGWIGLLVTMINLIPVGQLDGGHIAFAYFGDRYKMFCSRLHRTLPVLGLLVMVYVTWESLQKVAPQDPTLVEPWFKLMPLVSTWGAVSAGLSAGIPWLLWPAFILLLKKMSGGIYHPPVGDEPLSGRRRLVAIMTGALFVLIFTPIPMRGI